LAGGSAAEAIRGRDHEGRAVLVSDEQHLPYDRVPLSKEYLLGNVPRDSLFLQENDFYQQQHVEVWLGHHVEKLAPDARTAILDDGREIEYDSVLLATGGSPRRLAIPGYDLPGIYYLRTVEDSDAIQAAILKAHRAVVVGGGFIGCEIAAACAQKGIDTTIIEVGPTVLNMVLDQETAGWINQYLIDNRIHVLTSEAAARFIQTNGRVAGVETKAGRQVLGDLVAVGVGIKPNVELAQAAGLPVDNGIIVNEQLQVDGTRIYAAGDVARFYSPVFAKHLRLEHYDVAVKHGQIAGANMVGAQERFTELPYFFSFIFKLRTELWGDATQRELVVRRGPLQLSDKGGFAQFYLSQGRIQAYLSVNRPIKEAEAAKRLILSRQTIEDPSILGNESLDLNALAK
jgi:3-phenylpropionate/trans-cinnamate dioxygenase ferredoxin reductase subunit